VAWTWAAAVATTALGAAMLAGFGAGPVGALAALRATARLAFLFFWLAYAGGALAGVFGPPLDFVKRRTRVLGLAFATSLSIHLALVAWITYLGHPPSTDTFEIFGVGVACTGLLATFSIPRLTPGIGPRGWWILRNVAMNYLLFDFAFDFFRPPPLTSLARLLAYAPFEALVVIALAVRLLAWLKRIAPTAASAAPTV
jgi:hypothetical protein